MVLTLEPRGETQKTAHQRYYFRVLHDGNQDRVRLSVCRFPVAGTHVAILEWLDIEKDRWVIAIPDIELSENSPEAALQAAEELAAFIFEGA